MQRWNPDNPTSYSPSARTPTPLRRSGASQFTSSVFAAPPPPRVIAGGASIPRCVEGACETKQTSFEWPVRGVRELKSQLALDDDNVDDETRHEVLSGEGAYFDDLAYKLHLERSPDTTPQSSEPSLVLAVIALWAKYSDLPPDEAFDRTVFVGIKPYEREGERELGEPSWFWTENSVATFSKRQEYWEVTIPPLSELLEHPEINTRDAFSVRVVIKHTSEPGLPPMVHSDQQFISRRITRQATGFLDSIRTGDVQFVCLEHAGAGTPDEDGERKMVRRRVVYAHSELLVHSDYFKSTLKGGFAESHAPVTALLVDDAAFNTVYWVLRWLYTDEIKFSANGSVRAVMAQVRIDKASARKVLQTEAWEYSPLEEEDDSDIRTVRSGSSVGTSGRKSPGGRSAVSAVSVKSVGAAPRRSSLSSRSSADSTVPTLPQTPVSSLSRRKSSSPSRSGIPAPAKPPRIATSIRKPSSKSPVPPVSPAGSRFTPRRSHAPLDPHKHPTDSPPPPSPLAVFFLAHRYGLDELQALARDALLRNLTPETCIAALLATYSFTELHAAILDYVSDNWTDVSASPELDRCYQEVSAGVWGEYHGGQVLLGLTRRLTGMTIA